MSFSVRRYRATWTKPDGSRVLELTYVDTMGEKDAFVILRDGAGAEVFRLQDERLSALPGQSGELFYTSEEGQLRVRSLENGAELSALALERSRWVPGPRDERLLICPYSGGARLVERKTGETLWELEDACQGAFDAAAERVVTVSADKKTLSLRTIDAALVWEAALTGRPETVFFSTCGEFVGVQGDWQNDAPTLAYRADTGAEAAVEGVEFPLPASRLATLPGPEWPPGSVVEPWQRV